MRQASKSIVKMDRAADRAAIRQALAILEDSGVNITDDDNDDDDYDALAIPYSNIQISASDERRARREERLKLKQMSQHEHKHALLSPSRSKATRRASVTAFHSKAKQLHEDSSCNNSEATATTADLDASCCTSSHDDDGSSGSYSCSTTTSSLKSSEKHREAADGGESNTKRQSRTKRSKQRHSQAHKSSKKEEEDSNSSSSSSSCAVTNKSRRSIRFAKYDQIEYIPHINDISQTEINHCWMQEDDYNTIRIRSLRLVEMIEDPNKRYPISNDTMIVNTHLICVRGLCDMTTHCVDERDSVQRQLQTAVFRLQSQQQQDNNRGGQGADPAQAIRQVSRKYSKKSTKAARFVGISDRVTISI